MEKLFTKLQEIQSAIPPDILKNWIDPIVRLVLAILGISFGYKYYLKFSDPLMQFVGLISLIVASIGVVLVCIISYCIVVGRYN